MRIGWGTRASGTVIELADGGHWLRLSPSHDGWRVESSVVNAGGRSRGAASTATPLGVSRGQPRSNSPHSPSGPSLVTRFELQPLADDPRRVLRVFVPGRAMRLRDQAMLFALEDQLAGDVEDVERVGFYEVPRSVRSRRGTAGSPTPWRPSDGVFARRQGADYWVAVAPVDATMGPALASSPEDAVAAPTPPRPDDDAAGDGAVRGRRSEDWRKRLPASAVLLHADDGWIRICRVADAGRVTDGRATGSAIAGAWVDWPGDAPVFVPEALLEVFVTTLLGRAKPSVGSATGAAAGGDGSNPSSDLGAVPQRPLGVAWIEAGRLAGQSDTNAPRASDATAERLWSAFYAHGLDVWIAVPGTQGHERSAVAALASHLASGGSLAGLDAARSGANTEERPVPVPSAETLAMLALAAGVAAPSGRGFEWRRVESRAAATRDGHPPDAEGGGVATGERVPPPFEPLPAAWRALTPATLTDGASRDWSSLRAWRPAAALAAAALVAGGVGAWLDLRTLERELRAAESALEERFAALLPGEPMIDPVRQVDSWLASRGRVTGAPAADFAARYVTLVRILDAAAAADAPQGRVRIEALRIEDDRIELELTAPNLSAIEDLRRRFADARLLSNTQIEGGGVQAILRVDALGDAHSLVAPSAASGLVSARGTPIHGLAPRRAAREVDGAKAQENAS